MFNIDKQSHETDIPALWLSEDDDLWKHINQAMWFTNIPGHCSFEWTVEDFFQWFGALVSI